MSTYTLEDYKVQLAINPRWVERGIIVLFDRQTDAEQIGESTTELNGVGFNSVDAPILSSFAKGLKRGRHLTENQLRIAYRVMPKYARQLYRIAEERNNA